MLTCKDCGYAYSPELDEACPQCYPLKSAPGGALMMVVWSALIFLCLLFWAWVFWSNV